MVPVLGASGDSLPPPHTPQFDVEPREGGILAIIFAAMASPCEVLLEASDHRRASELGRIAAEEAWRIESKFSRYRAESIVSAINRSGGHTLTVDEETAALIDYAAQCHALSGGRFDITSGVLRRCWTFDGSDRVPDPAAVAQLLPLIGFDKIQWESPRITVPAGMEIDFGGFGKEYAVDRVLARNWVVLRSRTGQFRWGHGRESGPHERALAGGRGASG